MTSEVSHRPVSAILVGRGIGCSRAGIPVSGTASTLIAILVVVTRCPPHVRVSLSWPIVVITSFICKPAGVPCRTLGVRRPTRGSHCKCQGWRRWWRAPTGGSTLHAPIPGLRLGVLLGPGGLEVLPLVDEDGQGGTRRWLVVVRLEQSLVQLVFRNMRFGRRPKVNE